MCHHAGLRGAGEWNPRFTHVRQASPNWTTSLAACKDSFKMVFNYAKSFGFYVKLLCWWAFLRQVKWAETSVEVFDTFRRWVWGNLIWQSAFLKIVASGQVKNQCGFLYRGFHFDFQHWIWGLSEPGNAKWNLGVCMPIKPSRLLWMEAGFQFLSVYTCVRCHPPLP